MSEKSASGKRRGQASSKSGKLNCLEERIGYRFRDRSLLTEALTHRSHTEKPSRQALNYERLEFLGDSILGFLASEKLLARFPSSPEGQLTKLKAYLVQGESLVETARSLELGSYLRLGRGEEVSGGREKKGLLEDSLEALIAAIYLDGGLEAARQFVDRAVLTDQALDAAEENLPLDNFKSALQEHLQGRHLPLPTYEVVSESGPPHRRAFTIEARVEGLLTTRGHGLSKKSAGQKAARLALEKLQSDGRSRRKTEAMVEETKQDQGSSKL